MRRRLLSSGSSADEGGSTAVQSNARSDENKRMLSASRRGPMGIAFREEDEVQLTDPEGLAHPAEHDEQKPSLSIPFLDVESDQHPPSTDEGRR